MAGHVAKLQSMIAELRRQTDATVSGLHTIRARTSKVLAATEAFTRLSEEVAALTRALWTPDVIARLNEDATERSLLLQQLHLLIDQLDAFRQHYAGELSLTTPRAPKPKRPWWHVIK
jgi:methyl-accepting chemotaxis protein